ncbi:MAG TPA: hypothetical protein PKH07_07255 [bacterium]|nr:hypothetical protein [bacterium]
MDIEVSQTTLGSRFPSISSGAQDSLQSASPSSSGGATQQFFSTQDQLEISSEARASLVALREAEAEAVSVLQEFAAQFSASYQSQTLAQVSRVANNSRSSLSVLSQTTFNFSVQISASSLSTQQGGIDLSSLSDAKLKDYLILLRNFLKDMRKGMNEFFKDFSTWVKGDGTMDLDKVTSFINNLAGDLEDFLGNQAAGSNVSGVAASLRNINISLEVSASNTTVVMEQIGDPLVLDLDGDGVQLTSLLDGVNFDLNGDGIQDRMAALRGADAFLAWDRNGNGIIDNGKELFGDQHGSSHGFGELARFDQNRDGLIDVQDEIFSNLLLFVDTNRDGVSQKSELRSLMQAGIQSLSLKYMDVQNVSRGGMVSQVGSFNRTDGTQGLLADVWLKYI